MREKKDFAYTLLFLFGLLILLYPSVSSRWNAYRDSQLITKYKDNLDRKPAQELEEQWNEAVAYNEALGIQPVPDAFSLREDIHDEAYESTLDSSADGMMGYVEIPKIKIELPIYHYSTKSVLEKGAGHLFGSALPVGGPGTHAVVSAHRGLPSAEMFTNLDKLKNGDVFYYHILGKTLAYEVDQILVVDPDQVESLTGVEGQDYSTLITCTPYGINTQRLLVRGHRVEYDEAVHENAKKDSKLVDVPHIAIQIGLAVLGVLLSFVIVRVIKRFSKEQD